MNRIFAIILLAFAITPQHANADSGKLTADMKAHNVFSSLEVAANVGTTGLGLEVASHVTDWAKLRVGFDCMPQFKRHLRMDVENYKDGEKTDNFDLINKMTTSLTGYQIYRTVDLVSKPTMNTFRVLVDVYPFKANRHWHVTAGFFVGGNSIGTTVNTRDDMSSLMGVKIYDSLYETVSSPDFITNPEDHPLFGFLTLDSEVAEKFQKKIMESGELGIYAGDRADGSPCMILPDEDGILKLRTKVNRFRPYVGFGYGGDLSSDGRWQASFDAGVQIWGGAPKLTAEDGTVINDLSNLNPKTKSYVDLMKAMPVYPTIDFRISYRF